MTITFSKIQAGDYHPGESSGGVGHYSGHHGVFVDGELTYIIHNPVAPSRSTSPDWQIRYPDYSTTTIPSKPTLAEAKDRVILHINR